MQPRKEAGSPQQDASRRPDRLVRRIRAAEAGDQRAVSALLRSVAPAAARVVGFVIGPAHPESLDLVQDSLMEFLRALPTAGQETDLAHLAAAIALGRTLDAGKWAMLCPEPEASGAAASQGLSAWWRRRLGAPSPREALTRHRRAVVARTLFGLPQEQAEVLGLRLIAGLTLEQVAEMMGLSASRVRSLLRSAKAALEGELLLASAAARDGASTPALHLELHPEALRDLERAGTLTAGDRHSLVAHEAECATCTLERELGADLQRASGRAPRLWGSRLGRAVDAATAHWVWNVSRRVLISRRQRRWTLAAMLTLAALTATLTATIWSRYRPVSPAAEAAELFTDG
jgi:RNA polymerase sigma-70 factor (ECF subfamily)